MGNLETRCAFSIISQYYDGIGSGNLSLLKTKKRLFCTVNTKSADVLDYATSQGISSHGIDLVIPEYSMMTSSNGNIFRVTGLCARNSPVTGEFLAQRPVTQSFDGFFDLRLNKQLNKQLWGWWFETLTRSLWRHCNADFSNRRVKYYNDVLWGMDSHWRPFYLLSITACLGIQQGNILFFVVTVNPLVPETEICIGKMSRHWFRWWLVACSGPSDYLNIYWLIVNVDHLLSASMCLPRTHGFISSANAPLVISSTLSYVFWNHSNI